MGMAGSMAMPARAPRLLMSSRVRRGWRVVSGWIEMMHPATAANEDVPLGVFHHEVNVQRKTRAFGE